MKKEPIQWLSAREHCDICAKDISKGKVEFFVDGKVKNHSAWALMCPECFDHYGVGLGLGFGQKYDGNTQIKIEG